jgi:hypothetical protein
MRHLRRPAPLLLTALLFLGALGILAASGSVLWPQESRPPAQHVPPPPMSFPLYFDRSVSYEDALRAVTDLGLQPSLQCGYEEDVKAGRVVTHMQWHPAGQRAFYVSARRLFVALTPMTPPDWTTRIKQISGLLPYRQEDAYVPHYCSDASTGWEWPPSSLPARLQHRLIHRVLPRVF